jgi:hypothetical protein
MESTVSDFEMVKSLRNARIAAVQKAQSGQILQVLADPIDSLAAQVYVVKLLDVTPGLGKVAGRRLLAEIGVDPFARLCHLTGAQKASIQQAVGQAV